MPKAIAEQVIVITGASSGIGLATAYAAARAGARVVLAARNARDLERAVREIERSGGDALAVVTDVTSYEQVEQLAQRTVERYGRIDTWVNNAAVSAWGRFQEQPLADARQIMDVNFMGQVHGARAALPWLEQTGGALVCVGSTLSDRGVPLQGMYCASKHALKGWLDSLRVELQEAGSGVRVTLIKPSSINTPLFNKARTHMGVMPRPLAPVYRAELAAAAILQAAEGYDRDLFVGGAGKALSIAERISPALVDVQQRVQGFDGQRSEWPKASDAPANLYAPLEDDGGVHGDFVDAHERSLYQAVVAHRSTASLAAAGALIVGSELLERAPRRILPALARGLAGALVLGVLVRSAARVASAPRALPDPGRAAGVRVPPAGRSA